MIKADDIGRREMCPAQAGWFHYWKRRQYGKPLLGYVQSSDIIWHIFQKFLRILGRKGAPEGGTVMNAKRKRASSSWAALWQLTEWEVVWPRMHFANHFSESLRGTFKVLDRVWQRKPVWANSVFESLMVLLKPRHILSIHCSVAVTPLPHHPGFSSWNASLSNVTLFSFCLLNYLLSLSLTGMLYGVEMSHPVHYSSLSLLSGALTPGYMRSRSQRYWIFVEWMNALR